DEAPLVGMVLDADVVQAQPFDLLGGHRQRIGGVGDQEVPQPPLPAVVGHGGPIRDGMSYHLRTYPLDPRPSARGMATLTDPSRPGASSASATYRLSAPPGGPQPQGPWPSLSTASRAQLSREVGRGSHAGERCGRSAG